MQQVIWKDVLGYEGLYKVSNYGEVYSEYLKRNLKQYDRGNGYLSVMFTKDGKHINRTVHSVVAETFLGKPQKGLEIDHIDGDKTNNSIQNLRYITHSKNMNNPISKRKRENAIIEKQGVAVVVYRGGIKIGEYKCLMDAARELKVECTNISRILRNKLKSTGGYTFRKRECNLITNVVRGQEEMRVEEYTES